MKNKKPFLLLVLIVAVFLLAFEYINVAFVQNSSSRDLAKQFLVNFPVGILVALIDYWIILFLYKQLQLKNNASRILVDLLVTNLFAVIFSITLNYLVCIVWSHSYEIVKISLPLIIYNSILVLFIEIFLYNRWHMEAEKKIAVMEKEKAQYQYEMLKAQINPHFLFNSLNVLSSLAYQDAEKTNLFAKKLSGIYRYLLLTNQRPVVTLKEEIAFLENYLFLEQIRFEHALFVEIINESSFLNHQLIPVSLQLLVENAIKHNIATSQKPLQIRIEISSEEIVVSNNLQLRTFVDKGGVGLNNLRKQYALYGKEIKIIPDGKEFRVIIPFINL